MLKKIEVFLFNRCRKYYFDLKLFIEKNTQIDANLDLVQNLCSD